MDEAREPRNPRPSRPAPLHQKHIHGASTLSTVFTGDAWETSRGFNCAKVTAAQSFRMTVDNRCYGDASSWKRQGWRNDSTMKTLREDMRFSIGARGSWCFAVVSQLSAVHLSFRKDRSIGTQFLILILPPVLLSRPAPLLLFFFAFERIDLSDFVRRTRNCWYFSTWHVFIRQPLSRIAYLPA